MRVAIIMKTFKRGDSLSGKKLFHLLLITCLFLSVAFMSGCTPEYEVEVQADPEEAGEIKGEGTYEEGEEVTVEVESKEGYEFKKWEEDGEEITSDKDYKLEVSDDITLKAQFEKIEHEVSLELDDEEKGDVSGSGTYEYGEEVTLEAEPDEGYKFKRWEKDGEEISQDQEYEFEIEENKELVAKFEDYIIADEKLEAAIKEELGVEQVTKENIKELTTLSASDEDITNIDGIEHAVNLEEVDLFLTGVTDVNALAEADNLEKLNLLNTEVTDEGIEQLAVADNLEEVNLGGTGVTDVNALAEADSLEELYLGPIQYNGVGEVTDEGIEQLAEADNLKELSLYVTEVTDVNALAEADSLEYLNLAHTEVTDEGIEQLAKADNLKELNLGGTGVTDVNALAKADSLEVLNIGGTPFSSSGTEITDEGIEQLAEADNLEVLDLGGTEVTDDGIEQLAEIDKLEELFLQGTEVTDEGVANLAEADNLEVLRLSGTGVTDVNALAKADSLEVLNIGNGKFYDGAEVTDEGIEYLAESDSLKELSLSGTEVTEDMIEGLEDAGIDVN